MKRTPVTALEQQASEALRLEMKERGWSIRTLAAKLDECGHHIEQASLARLLTGQRSWSLPDYFEISALLQRPVIPLNVWSGHSGLPFYGLARETSVLVAEVKRLQEQAEAAMTQVMREFGAV